VNTALYATSNGTATLRDFRPQSDAGVLRPLIEAGGHVMGKTNLHELSSGWTSVNATFGAVHNPYDTSRVPGGSSGGSAVAVAARMAPLAIAEDTLGSIRIPSTMCGICGLRPTYGRYPDDGIMPLTTSGFDQVGPLARTVEDLALLLEEVAGYDERDPDTHPRGRGAYRTVAMEEPPIEPRFGFFRSGRWSRVAEDAQAALEELVEHLGGRVEEFELSAGADELAEWHRVIMDAEVAVNLRREWETGRDRLSAPLRGRIEAGHAVRAPEYLAARAAAGPLMATFTELFEQRYDGILTPAAHGTAPVGLESTGEPTFCTLWTMLGLPAVSLPLLQGTNGLPLGVQLVGPRHGDGRLLRTARWLVESVGA